MPMPVRPSSSAQALFGSKRSRDGPAPSHSVDSPSAAPPSKKVSMNEIEIQTAETSETFEKRDKDWEELCAKFDEYKEKAKDRDKWMRKYKELQIAFKEDEIRHLKLYMAKLGRVSPEVLATMNSGGPKDAQSRMRAQELCVSRDPVAPPLASQSVLGSRNTITDPSDTYMAPQFQELFEQLVRATMNKINRTSGKSLAGSSLTNAQIAVRATQSEHQMRLCQRTRHLARLP